MNWFKQFVLRRKIDELQSSGEFPLQAANMQILVVSACEIVIRPCIYYIYNIKKEKVS